MRKVNDLLFKVHPYGQQSTLGTIEHLKNPSIKAIEDFYAKHYVPENMAICLSGDLDPNATFAILEKYFSNWQNAESLRPEPKWDELPIQGREFIQVKYVGEEQVLMAFKTAPRFHEDYVCICICTARGTSRTIAMLSRKGHTFPSRLVHFSLPMYLGLEYV